MPPFHPWRRLRARPDVEVFWRALRGPRLGATDGAEVIVLRPDLTQVQRRCTVAHELAHIELEHRDGCTPAEETAARRLAARWLIDLEHLLDAYRWAEELEEVADCLWVDVDTLRARLDGLNDHERQRLVDLYLEMERPC
jgi:hypothetical protein